MDEVSIETREAELEDMIRRLRQVNARQAEQIERMAWTVRKQRQEIASLKARLDPES